MSIHTRWKLVIVTTRGEVQGTDYYDTEKEARRAAKKIGKDGCIWSSTKELLLPPTILEIQIIEEHLPT